MIVKATGGIMSPNKHRIFSLARLRRNEDGVAAVEFSLFAPILFFAGLTAIDVGMALTERMTIDHVLSAGASFAMADPGPEAVDSILETTAKKNFSNVEHIKPNDGATAAGNSDTIYIPFVKKYFTCSDDVTVKVADPSVCLTDYYTFYDIRAEKTYNALIMSKVISSITFTPSIQVQVR